MKVPIHTICEIYCDLLGIGQEQMRLRSRPNDDIKLIFAALVMLKLSPAIFDCELLGMPYGTGVAISRAIGVNRQQASVICHKAHSYYRLYKDFREKVNQLSKEISPAGSHLG